MSEADAVAAVLWVGVTLYAVFGGADFGAGFWALVSGGGERGERARHLIDRAIGPVWEANHVWLIFILVVLWTGFSAAFEAVMSTLFIPLCLAALGIVLRGAGFAFHESADRLGARRFSEHLFAASSVITPFFMGTVVGAIASGRVPVGNAAGDPVSSWLNPVSVMVGVLFVATGAYLAAVFLVSDARRYNDDDLERYFRARAMARRRWHRRDRARRHLHPQRRRALRLRRPHQRGHPARHPLGGLRPGRSRACFGARRGAARASWRLARWSRSSGAGGWPSTRTSCRPT